MSRYIAALALTSLILCVGVTACSEESVRWAANSKALDQKVLKLRQGTSIDAVRSKLGKPVSEFSDDEETALYYGLWRLIFLGEGLKRRVREHKLVHGPLPPVLPFEEAYERKSKALDSQILKLHRGMSIKAVKSKLGMPSAYEEVFEGAVSPEEILRYDCWELSFANGGLTRRTNF